MAKPVILSDAGPLVALFNFRERNHEWALARFREFAEPIITTETVLAESLYLLQRVPNGVRKLLALWERSCLTVSFSAESEKMALLQLMKRHADVPISLAHASLIRLSEIHTTCQVWTLAADFCVYRRHGRQTIPLLTPA